MKGYILIFTLLAGLWSAGCAHRISYLEIPVPDRHANMQGIETLFLKYLDQHPQDGSKLIRILTSADDALQAHRILTRAEVMRWINRQVRKEGFEERKMLGLFFIRSVYLQGWNRGYLNFVDDEDRELLQDLISGVMGALHRCQSCTLSHAE
jgi:hypothetical protein